MNDPAHFSMDLAHGKLHYLQKGDGPLLLLIHGSLCDYRYWRWQIDAFAQQYRVLAPSLRGYWPEALQTEDPGFTIAQQTDDLLSLIDRLSPDAPVAILGHSRGAQIAVEMAIKAPERVAGLIAADPGFRFSDEPETLLFHAETLEELRAGNLDRALAGFVNAVNGQDIWRHMVSWFKTMVKDNAYTLLSQAREVNKAIDPEAVSKIACPLLLISGANSPERYTSRAQRLAKLIPQTLQTTIENASHGMNLANPKAFNHAVLAFLDQYVATHSKTD